MAKLFTNARLYQEDEQVFRPNAWFVVANDHIVSRGTNDVPSDFSSLETTDLQDHYVMPSLINTHVHIANRVFPVGANQLIKTDEERIQNGLANLQTLQQNGVAFARALATTNDLDIDIAKRAEQQNLIGLQTAGRAITTVGGHGSKQGIVVATPAEMRAAVRGHFLAGVDNIKLFASGGIAFSPNEQPDDVQMSFELIQAAAQAVHEKSHARLAVHEEALEGVKIALRAGADGIEHAFDADDEAINLFLKTSATLTPTLTAPYVIVKRGDGILPEWMVRTAYKWAPRHMRALGQYAKAGVKLTLGTDAGSPLNGFNDTALEAQLMVMAGATPAQVLQAATINGAELLHIESEYGHLKTGAMANFIVMDQSPLENITAVNLPTVYYKGKLVSEAPDRSGELQYPLNKGSLDY